MRCWSKQSDVKGDDSGEKEQTFLFQLVTFSHFALTRQALCSNQCVRVDSFKTHWTKTDVNLSPSSSFAELQSTLKNPKLVQG
ncbi:hypothetical protein BgiBS90_007972, partial [Biomphalaria glabrata]